MKHTFSYTRLSAFLTALTMTLLGVLSSAPAQATTLAYSCPISASETTVQQNDWVPSTFTPISNLVNCQNPYVRNSGQVNSIALFFNAISPTAFSGNSMKIRLVGTPANYGYWVTMFTDKNVNQAFGGNPNRVLAQYVVSADPAQQTIEIPVTTTDAQKAKILEGDFVIIVGTIGGVGPSAETVDSVSIPYTAYSVTFDPNGGTGSQATQSAAGSNALALNTLTREGFTFSGWNTERNGQGTPYPNGALFNFDEDTTLYAQWTVDPFSALARTGSGNGILLGTFGATTVLGLLLVAYSIRRRQRN